MSLSQIRSLAWPEVSRIPDMPANGEQRMPAGEEGSNHEPRTSNDDDMMMMGLI